jgi:predicted SAM-dependent methyltransferase
MILHRLRRWTRVRRRLREAAALAGKAYIRMALLFYIPLNRFRVAKMHTGGPLKLNVGCGKKKVPGWVNIDMVPGADLVMDVRKGLPFKSGSVDYIFNEHLIEHLTLEEAGDLLAEFLRVLKSGGVLRVATPDLDYVIDKYVSGWRDQAWLRLPQYEFIETRGRMINVAFRFWEHKYLFNREDLEGALEQAGFIEMVLCERNRSDRQELAGMETREDSRLVMEAEKP